MKVEETVGAAVHVVIESTRVESRYKGGRNGDFHQAAGVARAEALIGRIAISEYAFPSRCLRFIHIPRAPLCSLL